MRKVRRQALKDYVLFPALTGPLFPLTLTGNAIANLVRNVWAFNIIFCGHFPTGAETFTEEECQDGENGRSRAGTGTTARCSARPTSPAARCSTSCPATCRTRSSTTCSRTCRPAATREIAGEIREICERYGLEYTTGPLRKQLISVAKKICRLAAARSSYAGAGAGGRRHARWPREPSTALGETGPMARTEGRTG